MKQTMRWEKKTPVAIDPGYLHAWRCRHKGDWVESLRGQILSLLVKWSGKEQGDYFDKAWSVGDGCPLVYNYVVQQGCSFAGGGGCQGPRK